MENINPGQMEEFKSSEAASILAGGSDAPWITAEDKAKFANLSAEDKAEIRMRYFLSSTNAIIVDVDSRIRENAVKFRTIDARNTVVSAEHYPAVENILNAAGWEPMPTTRQDGTIFINPRIDTAKESIQVLLDLAPYIVRGVDVLHQGTPDPDPECQVILERDTWPRTWLHLIYDGRGGVIEKVTSAHHWEEK